MNLYMKCWKHCADFSSRASRGEFWSFFLVNLVITVVLSVIAYLLLYDYPMFSKISYCYSLAVLLPGVAVCVRRLHDIGRSGWFFLLIVVPVIGLVLLAVLLQLKGSSTENDWGAPLVAEEPQNK